MKDFNKWWKKKYKSDFDEYKPIGEAGWKAALKWALKDLKETYDGDWDNSQFVRHINKELE